MPGPELHPLLAWGRSIGVAGEPTDVRRQPWALTARVGDVWLKACGSGGRHEAPLLDGLLRWRAPHAVLPLAVDVEAAYAALAHAGARLHVLDRWAQPWPLVLAEHAELQRRLQPHADDAVGLGVPDLRPAQVPERLDALLSRTALPDELRTAVVAALPALDERCALLASGPVAATVQHDDLNDHNVVVDALGAARVLDWGDGCVGHPFGVLLVTLRVLRHRGVDEAAVLRVRDAYLETWTDLADRPTLLALAEAAQQVQAVGRALSWERALRDADADERARHGPAVRGWLEVLAGWISPVRG